MKVLYGNLWKPSSYVTPEDTTIPCPDAICITTNGWVKKNGAAVMGRGCALQAVEKWPDMPFILGRKLRSDGNSVHELLRTPEGPTIVSFPVKPVQTLCGPGKTNVVGHMRKAFEVGDAVPGWASVAELKIIIQSAHQLIELANEKMWQTVVIPRPGCGAGELSWEVVKEVLEHILDDRFYVITYAGHKRRRSASSQLGLRRQ